MNNNNDNNRTSCCLFYTNNWKLHSNSRCCQQIQVRHSPYFGEKSPLDFQCSATSVSLQVYPITKRIMIFAMIGVADFGTMQAQESLLAQIAWGPCETLEGWLLKKSGSKMQRQMQVKSSNQGIIFCNTVSLSTRNDSSKSMGDIWYTAKAHQTPKPVVALTSWQPIGWGPPLPPTTVSDSACRPTAACTYSKPRTPIRPRHGFRLSERCATSCGQGRRSLVPCGRR